MGTGTEELRRGPTSQLPRYNQPCQNLQKGFVFLKPLLQRCLLALSSPQIHQLFPVPLGCARDVSLDTSYTQQINTGNQSLTRGGGLKPARLCSHLCQTNASPWSSSRSTWCNRQQSGAGLSITQPASGRDPPGSSQNAIEEKTEEQLHRRLVACPAWLRECNL